MDEKAIVVVNVYGGLVQDVGAARECADDITVVVVDHDREGDDPVTYYECTPTAIDKWVDDPDGAVAVVRRCGSDEVCRALGLNSAP
jgi:hypothetical protein